jgi:two-component sensor histidine kinase
VPCFARTRTPLAEERWNPSAQHSILQCKPAPFLAGQRTGLDGQPIVLPPGTAQLLANAVHKLAANAAKYGALSVRGGRVSVSWRLDRGAPGVLRPKAGGWRAGCAGISVAQCPSARTGRAWSAKWRCHSVDSRPQARCRAPIRPPQMDRGGRRVGLGPTDARWHELERPIDEVRPRCKVVHWILRQAIEAIVWRIRMAPNGGAPRPNSAHAGGQRGRLSGGGSFPP